MAAQFAAATASGVWRTSSTGRNEPSVVNTQMSASGNAALTASSTKRNAVTLGAKHLRELRGHRHRADERLGCRDTELGGHLAQHADEGVRIPLQLKRTRAHRHRAVVEARDLVFTAANVPAKNHQFS